jgi:hypothetical protein
MVAGPPFVKGRALDPYEKRRQPNGLAALHVADLEASGKVQRCGCATGASNVKACGGLGARIELRTHSQKGMVVAMRMGLMKLWAQRLYRAAILRQFLSLANMRSTRLDLHRFRSGQAITLDGVSFEGHGAFPTQG